jgi:hypothetical protein
MTALILSVTSDEPLTRELLRRHRRQRGEPGRLLVGEHMGRGVVRDAGETRNMIGHDSYLSRQTGRRGAF